MSEWASGGCAANTWQRRAGVLASAQGASASNIYVFLLLIDCFVLQKYTNWLKRKEIEARWRRLYVALTAVGKACDIFVASEGSVWSCGINRVVGPSLARVARMSDMFGVPRMVLSIEKSRLR